MGLRPLFFLLLLSTAVFLFKALKMEAISWWYSSLLLSGFDSGSWDRGGVFIGRGGIENFDFLVLGLVLIGVSIVYICGCIYLLCKYRYHFNKKKLSSFALPETRRGRLGVMGC